MFAYVGKSAVGQYDPFVFKRSLSGSDVEISDDVFLISRERAEEYSHVRETAAISAGTTAPTGASEADGTKGRSDGSVPPPLAGAGSAAAGSPPTALTGFTWTGVLPAQKWMNFYTKVLSRFATGDGMKLTVTVEVAPTGGLQKSKIDETRVALRELGLDETLRQRGQE